MKELTVSKNSWHFKIYQWWHKQKYGWTCYEEFTNLCPYMRAVMFWSWMRFLFLTKWWSVLTYAFLLVEIPRWAGMHSYEAKMVIYTLYGLVILYGTLFAACIGIETFSTDTVTGKAIGQKCSSFGSLVVKYSKTAHDGICPRLEIK